MPKPPKGPCTVADCNKAQLARGWCRTHYTRWYETGSLELGVRPKPGTERACQPLEERFRVKVETTETCWLWTGGKTALGYGMIWAGPGAGRMMAHRAAWEMYRGPIPDGYQIDHLCRVPSCVNPDHLEPVTPAVNTNRGYSANLAPIYNREKESCPQGHPYSDANTYIGKDGGRACRTCPRVRKQARRAAKQSGVPYVDPFLRPRAS